eukprot:10104837-Alexandrium_andersonii.AAC.1
MLVKSVKLVLSRCVGRLPIAEAPQREASPPLQRPSGRAPYYGRRFFRIATWSAAKRRPKLHCQRAFAHSTAPVGR